MKNTEIECERCSKIINEGEVYCTADNYFCQDCYEYEMDKQPDEGCDNLEVK